MLKRFRVKNLPEHFIRDSFRQCCNLGADSKITRDPHKPEELLCRKEFFELLIRLAPLECPDMSVVESLEYFLNKTLLTQMPPNNRQ